MAAAGRGGAAGSGNWLPCCWQAGLACKGWQMYRRAIQTTPIQGMYQQIQQRAILWAAGSFRPLYLQAVISVEDRRFEATPVSIWWLLAGRW